MYGFVIGIPICLTKDILNIELLSSALRFFHDSFLLIIGTHGLVHISSLYLVLRSIFWHRRIALFSCFLNSCWLLIIFMYAKLQFEHFIQLCEAWISYSFSLHMDLTAVAKHCNLGDKSTSDVILRLRNGEGRPEWFYSHSSILINKSRFFADRSKTLVLHISKY